MKTANKDVAREQVVATYFSQQSSYWNSLYTDPGGQEAFTKYDLKRRKDIVFEFVSTFRTDGAQTALDLGCGAGQYLAELSHQGFDCCGVDVSEDMLQIARDKLPTSSTAHLIRSDCCSVPLPDHQFDFILCIGVLEYLATPERALQEMKRLVKPDGYIIFTLPNLYKLRSLLNPYYYLVRLWVYLLSNTFQHRSQGNQPNEQIRFNYDHSVVKRYSFFEARRLAASSGLHLIEVRSGCFGPFSLWKNEIWPASVSIKASDRLTKLLEYRAFGFLNFFTNRWVFLVQLEPIDSPEDRSPQKRSAF